MNQGGQSRRILIAIIAAVVAAGGFALALSQGHAPKAAGTPTGSVQGPTVSVVVASSPIPQGTLLSLSMVAVKKVPQTVLPQGTVFSTTTGVVGKFSAIQIAQGTILQSTFVTSNATGVPSASDSVFPDPGDVAVAITTNVTLGLGYYIQPGDFINILTQIGGKGTPVSYGFQDVKVLKVGSLDETISATAASPAAKSGSTTAAPPPVVTTPSVLIVEMSPAQAAAFEYLQATNPSAILSFVIANGALYQNGQLSGAASVGPSNINNYVQ